MRVWLRTHSVLLLMVAVVAGIAIGMWLWVSADNGSKESELGAALFSTGLLGLLLASFERALSSWTERLERDVALSAAPEPAKDDPLARLPDWLQAPRHHPPAGQHAVGRPADGAFGHADSHRYAVELEGWSRDNSRLDADQLRLRVFRDGDYFQFFTAIVPGISFRNAIHGPTQATLAQFRRAFTDLAVEHVRREMAAGKAPLPDPTVAIEVFPDPDEAVRQARYVKDEEYRPEEGLASWRGPSRKPGAAGPL